MKDTDIEYLGGIPSEWDIRKVKDFFQIGRGRVIAKTEINEKGLFPVFSSQTKNDGCLGYIDTFDYDKPQLTWTTDGANAGTVFLRSGKYNCTNVCGTLFPKYNNHDLRFFNFIIGYVAFHNKRADTNGYKIMNNEMANLKIVIPPLDEQIKIANFLERTVNEIVNIIDKTKLSVDELKKYKQSIITEKVTKGMSNSVEMVSSGVDWIGDIPRHWNISKLRNIFEIKKVIANELGYDVLSVTQQGLKVKNLESNEGQLSSDYSKYQIVEKNDFVMNHMDLLTGWVDCSEYEGVTSPDYRVFRFKSNLNFNHQYYQFLLQACYLNKTFYGYGQGVSNLGRWRLPTDEFLNFYFPVPDIKEQREITNFLITKVISIDELIEKKKQLINDMEEYKNSIIFEYVTGKKEVLYSDYSRY